MRMKVFEDPNVMNSPSMMMIHCYEFEKKYSILDLAMNLLKIVNRLKVEEFQRQHPKYQGNYQGFSSKDLTDFFHYTISILFSDKIEKYFH